MNIYIKINFCYLYLQAEYVRLFSVYKTETVLL